MVGLYATNGRIDAILRNNIDFKPRVMAKRFQSNEFEEHFGETIMAPETLTLLIMIWDGVEPWQ